MILHPGTFPAYTPLRLLFVGFLSIVASKTALAEDKYCLDYFTVGESKCRPAESTPVTNPQTIRNNAPVLVPPQDEVDKFLENYGKPPREFVEFYVHPTADNAAKWAAAYQQIVQKGNDISKAWNQADQLYQTDTNTMAAARPSLGSVPLTVTPAPLQPAPITVPQSPAVQSFGGLSQAANVPLGSAGGVRMSPVKLTYYFSQICPYCARMTPDLLILSNEKASTLTFTCVDVTPLGPQNKPDEAFITSKLPCKWRLPEEGEVDNQAIRMTPTLLIEKEGKPPVRLSGYVPLTQLRQYF